MKIIQEEIRDSETHELLEAQVIECQTVITRMYDGDDLICGEHIQLSSSWANDCPSCGQEYNGAGQRLAPRKQWGYETGERF